MIDFGTLYLFVILSIFCACVMIIAVSCFWECFKEEIMQTRSSKQPTVDFNEENEIEETGE